jgi:hypothetical protein
MDDLKRREFLKLGGAAVVAGAAPLGGQEPAQTTSQGATFKAAPIEMVRIGYVGIGGQGSGHVRNLLNIPGCRITAVCDVRPERTDWATKQITSAGHPAPAVYTRGPRDFERLCETEQLDLVYNATPWEFHVPIMLAAMNNGKHTATEVPAAMTIADCWAMVEAAEKFQKHCVQMENCNYDRMEMMVYNMVRQGLFGEILHAEGGYLHDLRSIKFADTGEGLWRRAWAMKVDGNLYPTHGLGPIASCLDINRGDQFDYLVSMSGPSRGLQAWAAEHTPADSPKRREQYVLGDVNVSLIKTARGRTVVVEHCTNLPRPYSRIHMVQGTKGLFQGYPNRVYVEGRVRGRQAVRASALERSGRSGARGRPRRDGLHRGLPADQVPARRTADGHDRLRRRRAERGRGIEHPLQRTTQRPARRAGLHPRHVENEPAARHRTHVRGDRMARLSAITFR